MTVLFSTFCIVSSFWYFLKLLAFDLKLYRICKDILKAMQCLLDVAAIFRLFKIVSINIFAGSLESAN